MADWYGTSRSNYVKFIPEKLEILKELFEISVVPQGDRHTIISETPDGGTPIAYMEGNFQKDLLERLGFPPPPLMSTPIDFLGVLHLALILDKDNVFVWVEVGAEKARYITGSAIAIDHTGKILRHVSLDDVYGDPNWSRAEY